MTLIALSLSSFQLSPNYLKGLKHKAVSRVHYQNNPFQIVFVETDRTQKDKNLREVTLLARNQFQAVVQAQGAHEQTRAPRVFKRGGAGEVYTRDQREAENAEPTMERELSFVSNTKCSKCSKRGIGGGESPPL